MRITLEYLESANATFEVMGRTWLPVRRNEDKRNT